jgi:cytosine/adenosine deaminase-related metal-dependent hydrolase
MPPVELLKDEKCEITLGTDSLASNNRLDILGELKTLQLSIPSLSLEELIEWATINGARALNMQETFGKIETGRKPGLLLLENVDLQNMKLLPESFVSRLI